MSEDLPPYVIVERNGSGIAAFIWGAIVGAGVALLLAPKSGEETQREIRESARRFRDGAGEKLTDLRENVEDGYERTRVSVEDRVDTARDSIRRNQNKAGEAIKAGKDAASRARSDLEARVAESKAAYKAALTDTEPSQLSEDEAEA